MNRDISQLFRGQRKEGKEENNQMLMHKTKLHVIVIIEGSGLNDLEVMLKSLFTNGKVVENQVPERVPGDLLCKTQNVSIARSSCLPSGEVVVTFIPGSWLSCSGWMLHSWLLLLPLALAAQLSWLGTTGN